MHHPWRRALAPLLAAAGVVTAAASGGCAGTPGRAGPGEMQRAAESAMDKAAFADELVLFDEKQMAMAELALERSQNGEVQALAQKLGGEHAKHREQLQAWAFGRELELASLDLSPYEGTGGSGLDEAGLTAHAKKHLAVFTAKVHAARADVTALDALQGAEFDRAFLTQVREDQEAGLRLLRQGRRDYAGDSTFVAMLVHVQPLLEGHRDAADAAEKALPEAP